MTNDDLIHADWLHDAYIGRNRAATVAKRGMYQVGTMLLGHTPLVWTIHNLVAHDSGMSFSQQVKILQRFVDRCDGLLFLSHVSEIEFRQHYRIPSDTATRTEFLGNFVDDYPNHTSFTESRDYLGVDPSKRIVGLIGRLHPYKGVEDLIDAFAEASQASDVLLLAGRPSSETFRRALDLRVARARVSGRGTIKCVFDNVSARELQYYFGAADVVLMPFRSILNSASVVWAAGFGAPVVVPRLGSLTEYVSADLGQTYDPGRERLADVVRRALDENNGRDERARQLRVGAVRDRFSWERLAASAIDLYRDVLDVTRSGLA